jgi:hypothetical protein
MATITKLEQQIKDGKASGFKVELSDGVQGYLTEKDSDKGLVVGDTVTYSVFTPEGKSYKKITIKKAIAAEATQASQPLNQTVSRQQPQATTDPFIRMRFEARMKCIDIAHNAYLAGKLNDAEAKEHCAGWVAISDALINELAGK